MDWLGALLGALIMGFPILSSYFIVSRLSPSQKVWLPLLLIPRGLFYYVGISFALNVASPKYVLSGMCLSLAVFLLVSQRGFGFPR
jgi:hypothetical protein